ncbi:MAG: hypothetical protein VB035_03985 [Candidatus Fimivivens sp.]|nr:hypothetical protein [Candidatus Fimivivens sp.]
MIRMKIFKLDPMKFDFISSDEYLKRKGEKGIAQYNQKENIRAEEVAPIEDFITEIGFENVRSIITSTGSPNYLAYTIFYEDNNLGRR